MTINTNSENLRKLIADEGMLITDRETRTLRSREIYLGKNEDENNFVEIDENTPLSGSEQTEK